jgi:hypothetical protein
MLETLTIPSRGHEVQRPGAGDDLPDFVAARVTGKLAYMFDRHWITLSRYFVILM